MRGNLYAVNTVSVVRAADRLVEFEVGTEVLKEETVEFRHIVEAASLATACDRAAFVEAERCKDAYEEVKKVDPVSGELLLNGETVLWFVEDE